MGEGRSGREDTAGAVAGAKSSLRKGGLASDPFLHRYRPESSCVAEVLCAWFHPFPVLGAITPPPHPPRTGHRVAPAMGPPLIQLSATSKQQLRASLYIVNPLTTPDRAKTARSCGCCPACSPSLRLLRPFLPQDLETCCVSSEWSRRENSPSPDCRNCVC